MEENENRFAALLQPIRQTYQINQRDLAENWNIDIAAELEEYLEELEGVTFTFDGSGKKMNFAEGNEATDLQLPC
jgi:condensin-2 complex subunit H2